MQAYQMFMLKKYEAFSNVSMLSSVWQLFPHPRRWQHQAWWPSNVDDRSAALLQMWNWKMVVGAGAADAKEKQRILYKPPAAWASATLPQRLAAKRGH
jgi:hypothetical protein